MAAGTSEPSLEVCGAQGISACAETGGDDHPQKLVAASAAGREEGEGGGERLEPAVLGSTQQWWHCPRGPPKHEVWGGCPDLPPPGTALRHIKAAARQQRRLQLWV